MVVANHCDIYGCYRTKNDSAVVNVTIDDQQKTYTVCDYHFEILEVVDPSLYSIGLTYTGEPEIRLHPAVNVNPPA